MSFPVRPGKEQALFERMKALGVRAEDLEEKFIRSGGPGGQHVNKVSTCVVLVHRPTGLAVRCQQDRSQSMNRFLARRLLLDRIEAARRGQASVRQAEAERIRRQKRRRSRRSRQRSVEDKRLRSETKRGRGPVGVE